MASGEGEAVAVTLLTAVAVAAGEGLAEETVCSGGEQPHKRTNNTQGKQRKRFTPQV
jgi:hypothetical protein